MGTHDSAITINDHSGKTMSTIPRSLNPSRPALHPIRLLPLKRLHLLNDLHPLLLAVQITLLPNTDFTLKTVDLVLEGLMVRGGGVQGGGEDLGEGLEGLGVGVVVGLRGGEIEVGCGGGSFGRHFDEGGWMGRGGGFAT